MTTGQAFIALLLFATLLTPLTGFAAVPIVVGNGTPASCTEIELRGALLAAEAQGGGTIRFNCGEGHVVITVTPTLTIPNETTIDGEGKITITGPSDPVTGTLLLVDSGATVVLKNLSTLGGLIGIINLGDLAIHHGAFVDAVFHNIINMGTLTVQHSIFSGASFDVTGGGIFNFGRLTVHNSTFSDNLGNGIYNAGTTTVQDSTFSNNRFPEFEGGGILNFGALTVRQSTFSDNSSGFRGGGISNWGIATIDGSMFSGNDSDRGGAIFNIGTLTVLDSTITQNSATIGAGLGGGIFSAGSLTISRSTVTANIANSAGGGIYICVEGQVVGGLSTEPCQGILTVEQTSVTGNTPDDIFP